MMESSRIMGFWAIIQSSNCLVLFSRQATHAHEQRENIGADHKHHGKAQGLHFHGRADLWKTNAALVVMRYFMMLAHCTPDMLRTAWQANSHRYNGSGHKKLRPWGRHGVGHELPRPMLTRCPSSSSSRTRHSFAKFKSQNSTAFVLSKIQILLPIHLFKTWPRGCELKSTVSRGLRPTTLQQVLSRPQCWIGTYRDTLPPNVSSVEESPTHKPFLLNTSLQTA